MGNSDQSTRQKKSFLSIVIPIFNSKQFYKPCLESIFKSNYSNYELILVDDGSNDGSIEEIEALAKTHPQIKIIRTLTRRGIPRSRDTGIEFSSGDLIALLDIDMEVSKGWPGEIIKILEDNPDIGGIVPKVLDFQQRDVIQAAGIYLIPQTCWAVGRGYGEKDEGQYDQDEDITIGGAGSIVRKKVLSQLGGFDETLGMFDDIDMGWRISLLGWRTYYTHKATIYHWTSKPWSKRPNNSSRVGIEFYIDNLIRPLIKNLELKNLIYFLPQAFIIMFVRIIIGLFNHNSVPLQGAIQALSWNIANLNETLEKRRIIQSTRKVSDNQLEGKTFIKGNFISIYFRYLKPALKKAKTWPQLVNIMEN